VQPARHALDRQPDAGGEHHREEHDGADGLHDAGFAWPEVLPIIIAFDNFILGSALDMGSGGNLYTPDPQMHPALTAAVGDPEEQPNPTDVAFELGLSALLTG
jgi:hypothetical protein